MPRRVVPALALLALLLACAAHEKAGDRAAQSGDWRTAERAYAAALREHPDRKELQDKYREARAAALADATRRAQACAAGQDWECALSESSYGLELDPGSAALAVLRRDAGREAGHLRVRRARDASRDDPAAALRLLVAARDATDDAGVAAEIGRARPGIVSAAVDAADRLRAGRRFPEAIELLALAAQVDPSRRDALERTRAEYEAWKDAEAERLTAEGESRVAQRRFQEAKASFDAALALRPQGRARALSEYAAALAAADAASTRGDFGAAERALGDALRTGVDGGLAAAELDRVRVRPWSVRLRSLLVQPLRPDGWPWAGARSRELDHVVARLARFEPGAATSGRALDLVRRIPPENQPDLLVTVTLPDGRTLRARPVHGLLALLDARFVVLSNGYDDRTVTIHVAQALGAGARPLDVGELTFRMADLLANRGASAGAQSIVDARLDVDPADAPDGACAGLAPAPDATNLADAASLPSGAAARGFRLVEVEAVAAPGAPRDLAVELEQRGSVVYRTPAAPRRATATWTPAAIYLFAAPAEPTAVRLLDAASGAVLLSEAVPGAALERGLVDVRGPAGGSVRLRLEPRHAGPRGAAVR